MCSPYREPYRDRDSLPMVHVRRDNMIDHNEILIAERHEEVEEIAQEVRGQMFRGPITLHKDVPVSDSVVCGVPVSVICPVATPSSLPADWGTE